MQIMLSISVLFACMAATVVGDDTCTCEAYDSCQAELSEKRTTCRQKPECVDLLTATPDADAVVACFDQYDAADKTRTECIEGQIGKPCEVEVESAAPAGKRRRNGIRWPQASGSQRFIENIGDYVDCVRECVREKPAKAAADHGQGYREKFAAINPYVHPKLSGESVCVSSLGCAQPPHSELKAAKKSCREQMVVGPRKQLCGCLQTAGVADACVKPPEIQEPLLFPSPEEWAALPDFPDE